MEQKKNTFLKQIQTLYTQKTEYFFDLLFNTLANKSGIISPRVYFGHFKKNKNKELQKIFHDALLSLWFKRQAFQTVFKGQTAGIVKKLHDMKWFDEAHIRFYKDGAIDVELEQGRFSLNHWRGKRVFWKKYLVSLVKDMHFADETKQSIIDMIEDKDFAAFCKRSFDNPRYKVYRYIIKRTMGITWIYVAFTLSYRFF